MIVKCPCCGKSAETSANPFRPFCSERCKLIDLGNWISGNYRIPEDKPEELGREESDSPEGLNKE